MPIFYIQSAHLQFAEPLMEPYYDYHPTMLVDEMQKCVENSGIDYIKRGNGMPTIDFDESFREHDDLKFIVNVLYKDTIQNRFKDYFPFLHEDFNNNMDKEAIIEDFKVYLSLMFMSYVYQKETKGLFQNSIIIDALDIEYQYTLHGKIYPEMLSLYRIILESKTKKNRSSKITLTYKQDKIDINSCAWFLDDMEKYFKERFPDLTLEKINELLPNNKGKAGRKFNNRITNNLIWGTYQLLYNHHSRFKNSKTRISEEICQFIIDYLDYLEIPNDFILVDIRDWLKDMIKRGYTPRWDLPWRNAFSNIQEKEVTFEEKLNQPLRRYDIYN